MEEKLYETCAKQVVVLLRDYRVELDNIKESTQKVKADPRYTELGKKQLLTGLVKELKDLNESTTEALKKIILTFCDKYKVTFSDDKGQHQTEIANALKIIDMCGMNLSVELLQSTIEPLKSSYKSLKMIRGVLEAKDSNPMLPEHYDMEIFNMLDGYMGSSVSIEDYTNFFDRIKEILNYPVIFDSGIGAIIYGGSEMVQINDTTPYNVLCLGDNMMNVGKMYEVLSQEYLLVFEK
ncbi:hypothetical protein acsn021_04060 [Anaerocolumna cellulosilytica]|uniref:Uncharacterized protein n=1 Tax=Anaerocolumna cellulosilytica TaxID=433286 RepID=A0A6S6QY83_9FIRM|nr:hypothetical protein [Anaerocolumna cellulosilytica]MBB5197394.1 hypothetical protein [Anaerocolumna cellulosilytica]BCJ92837.1 hypothetical protein acsn021_04060 [Anaerocolumna cellulosilytica]